MCIVLFKICGNLIRKFEKHYRDMFFFPVAVGDLKQNRPTIVCGAVLAIEFIID